MLSNKNYYLSRMGINKMMVNKGSKNNVYKHIINNNISSTYRVSVMVMCNIIMGLIMVYIKWKHMLNICLECNK